MLALNLHLGFYRVRQRIKPAGWVSNPPGTFKAGFLTPSPPFFLLPFFTESTLSPFNHPTNSRIPPPLSLPLDFDLGYRIVVMPPPTYLSIQ